MPPYLDHIIILLPYQQLLTLSAWIPKNFAITPGGTHADRKTENKLICFEDGSYIEFISFINDDPALRKGHWWGDHKFGIIDFAFTDNGDAEGNWEAVNRRLAGIKGEGSKIRYIEPVEGGRRRPDGDELRWKVTFPRIGGEEGWKRGELPFFCHDITSRSLRVPNDNTMHPTFGYGIKQMSIFVPEERVPDLAEAYAAILDTPNIADTDVGQNVGAFKIERMNKIEGAESSIHFYVVAPPEEWQAEGMKERNGVMLGDIVVGGLSMLGGHGMLMRIDIPIEEGVGRIFLDLDMPSGWSQPSQEEWEAGREERERVQAEKKERGEENPELRLKGGETVFVDPRGEYLYTQSTDERPQRRFPIEMASAIAAGEVGLEEGQVVETERK